jgi:glycosyltransferase involved in cell wall biosynthesis
MTAALILTLNEERNLPACLDSVAWCDEVLVLDSFSADRTVEVARERGVRVLQRRFDDFASQRNFGVEQGGMRSDWILHVDADERVTGALRDEILGVTRSAMPKPAYRVASKLMFQGRWLRHAGMYPAYQVRLGRREVLRFAQAGHGQREALPPEQVGTLREALIHEAFSKGLDEWRERHRRYADAEAVARVANTVPVSADLRRLLHRDPVERRRAAKRLSWQLPARPWFRFLYMAVLRGGALDGRPGLEYCRLMAGYERLTDLKVRELRSHAPGSDQPVLPA